VAIEDGTLAVPATTVPPAIVAAAAQATAIVGDPAEVRLTSAQLRDRLDETRRTAESAALKALGFDTKEQADAFLRTAKALQDAQLTEAQKQQKLLEELTPKAQRADALAARVKAYADREFSTLPEAVQKAIDETANGDPEKRLDLVEMMRKSGLLATSGAAAPAPAPAPANAGAGQGVPPKPTNAQTPYDQWQALVASGKQIHADLFYQANVPAIAASRPKD
jgi:hypothetical protein